MGPRSGSLDCVFAAPARIALGAIGGMGGGIMLVGDMLKASHLKSDQQFIIL
jgi:hypothetical protein